MPIYIVLNKTTGKETLVKSDNKSQCIRKVAEEILEVKVATSDQVFNKLQSGAEVEEKVDDQMEITGIGDEERNS